MNRLMVDQVLRREAPAEALGSCAALLAQMPFGLLVCRGNALRFANPRAAQLHGLDGDPAEAMAALVRHFASDPELSGLLGASGPELVRDYSWELDAAKRRWLRATSATGVWEGESARLIWLQDISDDRERELALGRGRDRMADAQRVTHIGNWEWDLRTGACSWSDELYRIHGREPASFEPAPFNEICLNPEDVDLVRERLDHCIRAREPITFEYRILRPSGEERVIEAHVNLIVDGAGEPVALTGAANDVTRDKVFQGQLSDEKRRAEQASRAKTEFMANMSHELRTPLNAIIGFSEVMRREMFGPLGERRYLEYVASIHESGSHLLRLINDILDLSKVEAGKYRLREEPVDLRQEIEQCLSSFVVALESKGLELVRRIPARLPRILADRRVVQQILLNLVSNAVKFTQSGSVAVEVGVDPGLTIAVSDTGIGIAQADLAKALEPFEQIQTNASVSHEGTGIGLPLTKRLLEAHGGDLVLISEPGIGTSARARFPQYRVLA